MTKNKIREKKHDSGCLIVFGRYPDIDGDAPSKI